MRTFPVTISVHAVDSLEVGVRFWGERLGLIRQASHHRQRRSSREAALSPWTAYSTCQRLRPSNTSRANCCIDLYTKLTQSEHFPRCWTFSPAIIPLFPRAFFMAFVFPLKANGHHALASFVAAVEEIPENRNHRTLRSRPRPKQISLSSKQAPSLQSHFNMVFATFLHSLQQQRCPFLTQSDSASLSLVAYFKNKICVLKDNFSSRSCYV